MRAAPVVQRLAPPPAAATALLPGPANWSVCWTWQGRSMRRLWADSSKAAQRRPAALHAVWRSLAKATLAQQAALQSRERTLLLLRQLHHGNAQKIPLSNLYLFPRVPDY